ncbi:MAG: DUF1772 domain-containing protein [Merismopedia sp. SIO2A8]|nr:DUF1772 domain-containing protein [Merismopedia sp. SIO2A8]
MIFVILALLLNSALLTGNEFAVAAFIHPSLSHQDHRSNLSAIQVFANFYGKVMPIWMATTTVLHIFVCAVAWIYSPSAFPWVCAAALTWVIVIPYSLLFPVPLNNQVKEWDLDNLPPDWKEIRSKWDFYNWLRVMLLILAFVLLSLGLKYYSS